MNMWYKLTTLDRRWIYLTLGLVVVMMQFVHLGQKITISREAQNLYNFVDTLKAGDNILVAVDYDPAVMAEVHPMAIALMTHAFRKNVKVIVTVATAQGVGLAQSAVETAARRTGKLEGTDWVFLGYNPALVNAMQALGLEIRAGWNTDHKGKKLDDIPMLRNVHSYKDIKLVCSFAGSGIVDYWVEFAHERFNANTAAGVTGVMAARYMTYTQTGQLVGLLGGLNGAAEYETLIDQAGGGVSGMDAQSAAHILIILFIIIGNIAFLMVKRTEDRQKGKES